MYKSSVTQHYYAVTADSVTYANALQQSAAATYAGANGHLFVPNSHLEFMDVQANIVGLIHNDPHWLGITDAAVEGKWLVSAGPYVGADLSDLLVWLRDEPNGGTAENCAMHQPGSSWTADTVCTVQRRYVIEYECPFGQRFNDAGTACIGMPVGCCDIAVTLNKGLGSILQM